MRKAGWQLQSAAALIVFFVSAPSVRAATLEANASEIVKKSVVVNDSDWDALPKYSHLERDVETKLDSSGKPNSKERRTYRVLMIEGSPYEETIAVNGKRLSKKAQAREQAKLREEIDKRSHESKSARSARIGKYKNERAEEHLLMNEMVKAFTFKLAGEEKMNGQPCYVLDASPRPDYNPPVTKARVLTGMKGRLWIDKDTYHWVRVHAQVFKPVEFGFFIAKVRPGTQFELEQAPIGGNIWLPVHFSQSVNARVLGFYGIRSNDEEFYSDYQRADARASAYPKPSSNLKHE